jgi:hypothetical protein
VLATTRRLRVCTPPTSKGNTGVPARNGTDKKCTVAVSQFFTPSAEPLEHVFERVLCRSLEISEANAIDSLTEGRVRVASDGKTLRTREVDQLNRATLLALVLLDFRHSKAMSDSVATLLESWDTVRNDGPASLELARDFEFGGTVRAGREWLATDVGVVTWRRERFEME